MPCRDDQHVRVVKETVNGTYTYTGSRSGIKGEIDHENDCGGFEAFPEETRSADFDTDQDGMPNWYEIIIGSDVNAPDNNADPDCDGYTLLEDYLEFMAHPYVIIEKGQSQSIDVAPFFKGFTKSPSYTIMAGEGVSATIQGSMLNVAAGVDAAITAVQVTVTDSEGSTMTRPVNVAIGSDPSGIEDLMSSRTGEVVSREFFTLDGKRIERMQSHEVYIMKIQTSDGNIQSVKIIAD